MIVYCLFTSLFLVYYLQALAMLKASFARKERAEQAEAALHQRRTAPPVFRQVVPRATTEEQHLQQIQEVSRGGLGENGHDKGVPIVFTKLVSYLGREIRFLRVINNTLFV